MANRVMSLTPELVARCHRVVEDAGPSPNVSYLGDEDYAAMVETALTGHVDGSPLWLFAYGSLIWKPEIEHVEERVAMLHGWRRSFCMKMTRWRGTVEQPGLMLSLDRGGACQGLALRLPDGDRLAQLNKVFRREMTLKPTSYAPRWLKVSTNEGPVTALGFVINRKGRTYSGRLSDWQVCCPAHAVIGAPAPTTSTTPCPASRRAASMTAIFGGCSNSLPLKSRPGDSAVATVPAG